jgi:hypothetical protein
LYRYDSDYPGYNGSYFDGNIQIQYANGSLGVSVSGNWVRTSLTDQTPNIITITFPNGYDGSTLVNYINQQFQGSSISQVRNLIASGGSGPQNSYNSTYYYGFSQGSDPKTGGLSAPGNCNVNLDGTVGLHVQGTPSTTFTSSWQPNTIYTNPSDGTIEPWIGMQGIACDYAPNQGTCQTMFYNPDATGDCQICDSELWDWVPGGWEAVVDQNHTLHNLALTAYIPKYQDLKHSTLCDQTSDIDIPSQVKWSVPFCGKNSDSNSCTNVCSTSQSGCSKMSWNPSISDKIIPDNTPTVVDNLVPETGGMSNSIPAENCPDMICERNPVLTLRGTSEEENNKLAINWMNGIFDLSTLHGETTGIEDPIIPDLRVYGQPDELAKRTIKALRCCLGVNPGFKSSDGGLDGGPKTKADPDPYGGYEMWNRQDCPPGTMCPSSDTCKNLFKSVLDGSNQHVTMNLTDFGSSSYPTDFSLDGEATGAISEKVLMNPAYYAKAYCEMMSGGATKTLSTIMGLDDDINTICRKTMYNYCISPVKVDVIEDANYWNAPLGATTAPEENANYSKMTYELPLRIFDQGCNLWFKNELQEVMPSDYGTRNMLLGSACQRLQVDGWYNPVAPDQSPILKAFVTKDGKINDISGSVIDLSYVGSATATSGQGSIPTLLANTCNCFLRGSECQGDSGSNCSYQYCGAGMNTEVKIDFGNPRQTINPLNKPVDLSPYTNTSSGDSSWTRYQDPTAPSWKTGLDTSNFTCATGNAPQGMTISGDEAGGAGNCFTGCNYVNEYDVCWNASPTNRKYSGELLGGKTQWDCNFSENFSNINTCDPSKGGSYSCYGDCEHGNSDKNGSPYPSCGTQTWFDSTLNLNPGEIKVKKNRTSGKSDISNEPYWQNFYSGNSTYVSSAHIPNIGTIYNPSRSILSSDPYCNSLSSIKPYNLQFSTSSDCIISQGNVVNNQGIISGSVGISNLGSCNVSSIFQGHDKMAFLTYMGAIDCTGKSEICWNNNSFCLTDGTTTSNDGIPAGENCMVCGSSSDKNSISAPGKPNTCCLDPSINNDPVYQAANSQILSDVTLGKNQVVSYFCTANSCPTGSTDLSTLVGSCGTGFTCPGATDQATCEGCDYCKWVPVYQNGVATNQNHCIAVCPTAPVNGWKQMTNPPTIKPTVSPSTGNGGSTSSTTLPIVSSLSNTEIGILIVGLIIGVLFFANLAYVLGPKMVGATRNFGKSRRLTRGYSFGKMSKRIF